MSQERYVALGLAPVRTPWFTEVARWSTSAALPLEFVKCLSRDEAVARLTSGRLWSALVVAGTHPGLDRDLLALAAHAGCAVLVVDDPRLQRDWLALGANVVLSDDFGPAELTQALEHHARPVHDPTARPAPAVEHPSPWRGSLVALVGPGGTGCSTLALALTQALAADARHRGLVLLADLARRADQALLHDARHLVPALPELVDAHRAGTPEPAEIHRLTHDVTAHGYRLLLGLRRPHEWAALRPRALHAALDTLVATHRVVIADTDADLEGEADCGSVEVEERNLVARTIAARADLILVVGRPGLTGIHGLCLTIGELIGHGVPAERVQPVVNRAGRPPRARAETTRTVADLVARTTPGAATLPNPIYLGERRGLDDILLDRRPLPDGLGATLRDVVTHHLDSLGPRHSTAEPEPCPVAAGSLGSFTGEASP